MATEKTITIRQFSDMLEEYQDDVNNKIPYLKSLSDEIHHHLCDLFSVGYTISTKFREKNVQRIVEKDVLDYAGDKSFDTQVKDIFAARLCPSSSHHRGSPSLSDKEIKDKIQFDIKSYFKRFPNIRSTVENNAVFC